MGFALSLSGVLSDYRWYGVVARRGALPAASHLAGLANGINIVFVSCAGFILLLTPTGRLPSPRWRWWARVAAAAAVVFVTASVVDPLPFYPEYPQIGNPLGVQALAEPPLDVLIPVAGVVVLVSLLVATGASILRYRLYDIDRIISRTLAYALLTLLLGAGYVGVVLGLGRLLPDSSSLVVAAAPTPPS